jgi:hypothetical protein
LENLESRHLMAALPLGATAEDTGEFMLGRVAVIPVLFESSGGADANTENWTEAEIDAAIEKVRTGVQWWAEALDRLNTVHDLEFVIDDTFARNPFPTPYEPISRTSQSSTLYITPFLRAQGIEQATSLEDAVRQFNHSARERLQTDWAFTVFLVDSSSDSDGSFAPGSEFNIAFAYPGGLYVVSPSTRPASTITHEMGHIFWARDEYPGGGSWTDRRGYYNAQNLNASNNPTPGFVQEVSIMRAGNVLTEAYNTFKIPASTRAMIGWLDSDGDGIFDVADVPLHLEGNGRYDSARGVFTFDGNTRAVPLLNRNSSGTQNDITLNRVDRIEYRVDNGPWLTASSVNAQVADVSFELTISPFATIELRAIDDRIGVTSAILSTTSVTPLVSGATIGGFAFVDTSGEGENDPTEKLLANVTATLTRADGSPLFRGAVEPDNFANTPLAASVNGATLEASGIVLDGRVGAFAGRASTGTSSFHYHNIQNATWQNAWTDDRQLVIEFDEPVGEVSIDAIGISSSGSYGRLAAYAQDGALIARFTSDELAVGEVASLRVADPRGRIAKVIAFGQQSTSVSLDNLKFGSQTTVTTGGDGVFRLDGIPDGTYRLSFTPERLIHRHEPSSNLVTVTDGVASPFIAAFARVASPYLNPNNQFDVDGNGSVHPLDALRIINELSRNGARTLTASGSINQFFDTSDDGDISPLDALRVINELSRRGRSGASEGEGPTQNLALSTSQNSANDAVMALWNPELEDEKRLNPA